MRYSMKSLIILRGVGGQGKSTSLNVLKKKLEENSTYDSIMLVPHPDGYDWISIFGGPSRKVGIISFGDPGAEDHVDSVLRDMLAEDVDIIFAASRTRGGVLDLIYEFAKENSYRIIVTAPLHLENQNEQTVIETLNSECADMFINLIEKLSNQV